MKMWPPKCVKIRYAERRVHLQSKRTVHQLRMILSTPRVKALSFYDYRTHRCKLLISQSYRQHSKLSLHMHFSVIVSGRPARNTLNTSYSGMPRLVDDYSHPLTYPSSGATVHSSSQYNGAPL